MESTIVSAIKTWKGSKAIVTVTLADGQQIVLGGNRAARATAALVTIYPIGGMVVGLRADLEKAQVEAAKALKERKGYQTAAVSEAVPVQVAAFRGAAKESTATHSHYSQADAHACTSCDAWERLMAKVEA